MAKIIVQPDCGNAPRKLFLKELNIAFANGDMLYVSALIPDDIRWTLVGKRDIFDKEDYLKTLRKHTFWNVRELIIDTIITHGADASVSGQFVNGDGSAFSFCDVYRFKGASGSTLYSIISFVIKL